METYEVSKGIDTAKRVMLRRKVNMTKADEDLFNTIFKITESEREKQ